MYGHVARGLLNAKLPLDEHAFLLIDSIIYTFHMPLFFFLSGRFFYKTLEKHGRAGLLLNKADTILYPFVIWSLLQGSFEVALSSYTNNNVTFNDVFSLFWRPRAQFWFLYALFLVFVVSSIVYPLIDRARSSLLVLVFGALFICKDDLAFNPATRFIFENMVFFALGVWFNEVKDLFKEKCKKLIFIFLIFFLCGQYIFHVVLGLTYETGGAMQLALAIISIFFIVALSMCLESVRLEWLTYIGASSMTIYLMHILAGSGIRIVLNKLMGIDSIAIHLVLGVLIGIGAPLLAQVIIRQCGLNFLLAPPKSIAVSSFRYTA